MSTRSVRLRAGVAGALAGAVGLLSGCVQMPTSGPVVEPDVSAEVEDAPGFSFDPRPPQPGAAASEIVSGFLEAMKATPISVTVARQFLSEEAAAAWEPEQEILTYADLGDQVGESRARVPMIDVNTYDVRGAWQRTQEARELDLELVQEDGQWRIDRLPDALIVPESWFDDWYERVSLYYFDPTAQVLVPEPVFAPRGEQFASSLVRGLLTQPTGESEQVVRTFFPPGTSHGLSVPIAPGGIAQVSLTGDPDSVDEETVQRMLAQLVWTLRQDDRIRAVQLSIGGRTFGGPSGATQVTLDVGSGYDPNGVDSTNDLFALDPDGLVVGGTVSAMEPTLGPLGQTSSGLREIGVSLTGADVAGVTVDGTRLVLAPVEAPDGEVTTPVVGAVDLGEPAWDFRDRVWVLDRGAGRARVLTVLEGKVQEVEVPGVSGEAATKILVSRDGSRLVAVVRGPRQDRVVSVQVRHDQDGAVIGFTMPQALPLPREGSTRVRDIGWRSPTTISALSDITDETSQVRTVSVDGAPADITPVGTTQLRGGARLLVSSPVDGSEVYALAGRSVFDVTRPERSVPDLPEGLRSLTYVG